MSDVKPITKVSISVCLKEVLAISGPSDEAVSLTFIYGIGRDGLSPFECFLEGAHAGDHIIFDVKSTDVAECFAGLFSKIQPLIEGKILPEKLSFGVEVKGIGEVENREVVAALASSTSGCGSGGSCGCGCS